MSRAKRKVEELGEQVLSAAVRDVFTRAMSAAVDRYEAQASVEDQLERLGMLVIMVHSAVDAAEGVHIRSWWLRRWLWRLHDAALDGDEVLRSLRHQHEAEEAAVASNRMWNAAWHVFRSAKSSLLGGGGGGSSTKRLGAAVARLERASTGLGDFLKLLDMEIRRSRPATPMTPPFVSCKVIIYRPGWSTRFTRQQDEDDALEPSSRRNFPIREEILHGVLDVAPRCRCTTALQQEDVCGGSSDEESTEPSTSLDGSESEHDVSYNSYKEHSTTGTSGLSLMKVWLHIRRAMDKLAETAAVAPASTGPWTLKLNLERLRGLVVDIRRALRASDRAEVNGKRWLAEWRRELQGVADRAGRVLILVPETNVATSRGDMIGSDEMRRTAQSVEMAATHLKCFVTLVRLAIVVSSI